MPLHTQGTIAVAVSAAFALFAFLAIATRMYVKLSITKNFGWNDVGMSTALAVYMALLALLIDGCINGIGGHTALATIPGITSVLKAIWFLEIIYVILTSVMKASIAITMMRWTSSRVLKLFFWGSIGMDVLISSIFTFYVIFQCTPISYAWEMLNPKIKGKCLPFTGQLFMGLALCFVTFALDVLLMTSPFIMMKGRGLNKILKRYIYGIFSLGIAATIANIIRLFAIFKLQKSKDQLCKPIPIPSTFPFGGRKKEESEKEPISNNRSDDAAPVFTWSAVEVSIGIIIAGLIEMGPLMAKWGFPGFESYNRFASLGDEDTVKLQRMQSMDKTSIVISDSMR
ncbi:P-type ATPase [Diplocarpon rosae]|nr:P-type ATPase [Diplocarpon rosae]